MYDGIFQRKNGDTDDFGVISRKIYSVVTPMAMTVGVYYFEDVNMEIFDDHDAGQNKVSKKNARTIKYELFFARFTFLVPLKFQSNKCGHRVHYLIGNILTKRAHRQIHFQINCWCHTMWQYGRHSYRVKSLWSIHGEPEIALQINTFILNLKVNFHFSNSISVCVKLWNHKLF